MELNPLNNKENLKMMLADMHLPHGARRIYMRLDFNLLMQYKEGEGTNTEEEHINGSTHGLARPLMSHLPLKRKSMMY